MRKHGNSYREGLAARMEEARRAETVAAPPPPPPAPEPAEPAAGFTDPGVRSELLADQLRDVRLELDAEREARRAAENHAARLEAARVESKSRATLSSLVGKKRRAPWK